LLFRLPASVVMAGLEPAIHGAPLRLSLAATILRRIVSGLRKCARVLVDGRDEPGHDGGLTTVPTSVAISATMFAVLVAPSLTTAPPQRVSGYGEWQNKR